MPDPELPSTCPASTVHFPLDAPRSSVLAYCGIRLGGPSHVTRLLYFDPAGSGGLIADLRDGHNHPRETIERRKEEALRRLTIAPI